MSLQKLIADAIAEIEIARLTAEDKQLSVSPEFVEYVFTKHAGDKEWGKSLADMCFENN
jgi:hypothetical protein